MFKHFMYTLAILVQVFSCFSEIFFKVLYKKIQILKQRQSKKFNCHCSVAQQFKTILDLNPINIIICSISNDFTINIDLVTYKAVRYEKRGGGGNRARGVTAQWDYGVTFLGLCSQEGLSYPISQVDLPHVINKCTCNYLAWKLFVFPQSTKSK